MKREGLIREFRKNGAEIIALCKTIKADHIRLKAKMDRYQARRECLNRRLEMLKERDK